LVRTRDAARIPVDVDVKAGSLMRDDNRETGVDGEMDNSENMPTKSKSIDG
jgi:hypothetical protein